MQVRMTFRDKESNKLLDSKTYHYCDNLSVKKEKDSAIYDRSEDVSYYLFTVEFDCYLLQSRENPHLRFEHVFSVEVI